MFEGEVLTRPECIDASILRATFVPTATGQAEDGALKVPVGVGDEGVDGALLDAHDGDVVPLHLGDAFDQVVSQALDQDEQISRADPARGAEAHEVVGEVVRDDGEVRGGDVLPLLGEWNAARADDGESAREGGVEARGADDRVGRAVRPVAGDEAVRHDLHHGLRDHGHVLGAERLEVPRPGRQSAARWRECREDLVHDRRLLCKASVVR